MRVQLPLLIAMIFSFSIAAQNSQNAYPVGTYKLDESSISGEDRFGRFGEIKVRKYKMSLIIVSLEVCMGAPTYNSWIIVDTAFYRYGRAILTTVDDAQCRIYLSFSSAGVTVIEQTANYSFGCGFGHGVFADGYYRKTSQ